MLIDTSTNPAVPSPYRHVLAGLLRSLASLWAGLILGVSFLATIAKFQAPSLTLPVALDVGRHTFSQLVRVEWLMSAVVIAALAIVKPRRAIVVAWAGSIGLLVWEALWLLPILDQRVTVLLSGGVNPPSSHHILFVIAESARVLLLLAACVVPLLPSPHASGRKSIATATLNR